MSCSCPWQLEYILFKFISTLRDVGETGIDKWVANYYPLDPGLANFLI